ncbi:MAG: HAD family phosphatase [Betaproteobacteria bacterium]|nr:HAD family phosphatase [Betaproteobacteria bacterium]MBK8689242.1 HAD family phosphatase [Betaproteobacteria bacterium]MBL0289845.1 HAD family phosphatase [Betaproteobacteria bacterium]
MRRHLPRHRPAAVIFDMDGLMLDTEPLSARAWSDAAQSLGIAFDGSINARLIGRNFPDCRTIIHEHHGDDYPVDDLMRAWHGAYDAIVEREGLRFKPGLLELLAWLEAEAIPKAVATSTRRSRAQAKLAKVGVLARFAALVGGDEIARGKPAPDIFLEAAARLRIAPTACMVLEDSEPGMRGALAAGMTPVMVPDLLPPSAALLAIEPLVVATLHDVRAHLAALAK